YHPTPEEIQRADGKPVSLGKGQLPTDSVVVAEWNDEAGVRAAFDAHPDQISAIICEPMLSNSGCIPPETGFLEFLREFTKQQGALLIFDEVITGFRLDLRGAQGFYGVTPDLATYGKAVGAGTALSILAGSARYMDLIADGAVIHAGTLNGNPLALAAAKASLETLSRGSGAVFAGMHALGTRLRKGLEEMLSAKGHQVNTVGEGPVFQLSFMGSAPRNYRETLAADKQIYS
ncbi:MAG: aminotransferase class III-fold pyridoxal phosphate-dependent enzyme, partial [bacterium]|nr:aminotransferase class III-fold pyridoxal phosphate-dependent enzyme [bacterium]